MTKDKEKSDFARLADFLMNNREDTPELPPPDKRFTTEDGVCGAWWTEDGSVMIVPWLETKNKWAWGRRHFVSRSLVDVISSMLNDRKVIRKYNGPES